MKLPMAIKLHFGWSNTKGKNTLKLPKNYNVQLTFTSTKICIRITLEALKRAYFQGVLNL